MLSAPVVELYNELEILGLGTAVLDEDAPNFSGDVFIRGAELVLKMNGRLSDASYVEITNGGTPFLDNSGAAHADRLGSTTYIALDAGTLAFDPGDFGYLTQEVGYVDLYGGANQIDLYLGSVAGGQLLAESIWRFSPPYTGPIATATLNIRYIDPLSGSAPTNVHFALKAPLSFGAPFSRILPWATITRGSQVDWVEWEDNVTTVFNPLTNYETGTPADWTEQSNVLIDGTSTTLTFDDPSDNRGIHSLKLANGGSLILEGGGLLDLQTGGLLSTGSAGNQISGVGQIFGAGLDNGTDTRAGFVIHVHGGPLTIGGSIDFTAGAQVPRVSPGAPPPAPPASPMIKTGEGTLRINGDVFMSAGSLVINQGTVAFEKGYGMEFRTVIIGDGTGTDVLELPANHLNPIKHTDWEEGALPNIILHGTPYSTTPDSGESDAAILRFGGGTEQHAYSLHVEGRGMLDFVGGTESAPNMLWLEEFTLADFETTMLFIRNWEDKRDVLLVRHDYPNIDTINAEFLARINFEGYDAPAQWVYWSDEYWEIKPMPELNTYGAIFGVMGLGLFAWRRKRRA